MCVNISHHDDCIVCVIVSSHVLQRVNPQQRMLLWKDPSIHTYPTYLPSLPIYLPTYLPTYLPVYHIYLPELSHAPSYMFYHHIIAYHEWTTRTGELLLLLLLLMMMLQSFICYGCRT